MPVADKAFSLLKEEMTSLHFLALYDFDNVFVVETDASKLKLVPS